jgi:short-subunit dehydrogenase
MIVIVGASRNLGKVVAQRLASWDEDLVLAGRSDESLKAVANELPLRSERIHIIPFDLGVKEDVDQFVYRLSALKVPLRAMVLTAAGYYKGELLDETSESIDELLHTTFAGPVRLITQTLRTVPFGTPLDIVNITSVAAGTDLNTSRSSVTHVVTKAALHLFGVASGRELVSR